MTYSFGRESIGEFYDPAWLEPEDPRDAEYDTVSGEDCVCEDIPCSCDDVDLMPATKGQG
jgi:hypothetical protein